MNLRRIGLEAAISAALAFVLSLIVFGPLLGKLDVGWSGGDLLSTYVNSLNWGGFSYRVTEHFGFPLGMNLNYFPGIDITENSFAALVNLVTGSTFTGINLLIVLSFPLAAALAYLVIRMTGLQGALAIALAVAFAFIPYHWGRALEHTYLSTLYSAIVGIALVLLIGSGAFERRIARGAPRRGLFIAIVAVMVVVVAWTGVYYVAFTLILGLAALLWRFAMKARGRALVVDALPLIATGALAVIGFVPSILARGDAPLASLGERMPFESVTYAGTLAMAILPIPQSELPLGGYYNEAVLKVLNEAPYGESYAITNFGTWATALALLAFVIGLLVRSRKGTALTSTDPTATQGVGLGLIAYLMVVTVLFFVPWGLNLVFADVITAQIRGWNRLLPILLLFFVLGGAAAIHRTRIASKAAYAIPIALVLLALTAVDAVYPFKAAYAGSVADGEEVTTAARQYASDVNTAIPEKCGVLQLPYMAYPEHGVERGINDYDHFWVAVTNEAKEWSYGSVKFTDASTWAAQLPQVPSDDQLALLRGAGFCAIHLDTRGYISEVLGPIQQDLQQRLGAPVASGSDGAWELFDLRAVEPASARNVDAFLHQAFIGVDYNEVTPRETSMSDSWWWMRKPGANFALTPTSVGYPFRSISGAIGAPDCGPMPVTVRLTAGERVVEQTVITKPGTPTPFELRLAEPEAGTSTLTVEAQGQGCEVPGLQEPRFARVLNLSPR